MARHRRRHQFQAIDAGGGPALPSGALLSIFAMDYDSDNRVIPNRVRPAGAHDPLKVLTRAPRGCFATSAIAESIWSSTGFTTTANYAADLDGSMTAMRLVSTGAGLGVVLYGVNISCVAGNYAIVANVQANGGSQNWEYSTDGTTWTGFTATTTMTRFAFALALGATTNVRIRLRPASGVTGDISLGKFYLWNGDTASAPADLVFGGDGFIGTGPGATVNCTAERLALSTGQCIHYDLQTPFSGTEITVIAITKRTDGAFNNGFRDTFLTDILGSVSDGSISLRESETATIHKMGMLWGVVTEPKDTYSPNYFALGGYHAHVGRVDATSRDLWHDDVMLGFAQGLTLSTKSVYHWQTGTNNGFARDHHIAALMMWPRKLSGEEVRAALKYADTHLTANSANITRPVNFLLAEGDSITVGPANNSYVQQSLGAFAQPVIVHNPAIGGSMIEGNGVATLNLDTRMPLHLASIPVATADRAGRRFIATVFFGANDLQPYYNNATTFLAALESRVASLRAAGYVVGVATILPKGTAAAGFAAHNTLRATANTALAGWVAANKCDFIIDFAGDATVGPDAAANNATYYNTGDGIHPTAATHTILGGIYRTAVNAWLL